MIRSRHRMIAASAALLTAMLSMLATPSLAQHSHDVHEHGAATELKPSDFAGAPRDLVLWGDLARAALTRKNGQYKLTFMPAKIRALNGRSVTLVGYMTVIDASRRHSRFLLSAQPLLCDECHAMNSPTTTAEINTLRPQNQTDEPLMVRGTMEIIDDNPNGLVYRLNKATVLSRVKSKNERSKP